MGLQRRRNADLVTHDVNTDQIRAGLKLHGNAPASGGELEGIAEQIGQHLRYLVDVQVGIYWLWRQRVLEVVPMQLLMFL